MVTPYYQYQISMSTCTSTAIYKIHNNVSQSDLTSLTQQLMKLKSYCHAQPRAHACPMQVMPFVAKPGSFITHNLV